MPTARKLLVTKLAGLGGGKQLSFDHISTPDSTKCWWFLLYKIIETIIKKLETPKN